MPVDAAFARRPRPGRDRALAALVAGSLLLAGLAATWAAPANADGPHDPPRRITVALVGDVIAHASINTRARINANRTSFDYRPMFADVRPVIEAADLAICNLEGPIAPPGARYTGSPRFATPAPIVQSLKDVGFDRCSTATNHANDKGPAGVKATLDAFDAAGLGGSGTGRTRDDAVADIVDVSGVKVAHLSYTFGFSSQRNFFLRGNTWINVLRADQVITDATDARQRGAEVVIVSLHWGSEFRQAITTGQRRTAELITASGQVDLIAGHHAHVIQPIREVNGTWVLFGLGNFLSNQRRDSVGYAATQDGIIARVTFTESGTGRFTTSRPEVIPTWVTPKTFEILEVSRRKADPSLIMRYRIGLNKSWLRTLSVVGDFLAPPPAPCGQVAADRAVRPACVG